MMIKEILDALTGAFEEFGIFATDDWRDIDIPGAFVTVTNLSEFTLGSEFIARAEITFVVPDHGGAADVVEIGDIVEQGIGAMRSIGAAIEHVELNQQVVPPYGGKCPAATMIIKLGYDMEA